MHYIDPNDIESIEKKTLTFHAGYSCLAAWLYGSRGESATWRWIHDDKSSDTRTIRNVVTQNVGGDVEHRCRSCSVSGGWGGQTFGYAKGSARSQVCVGDGHVAPSVWCGYTRAIAGVDLHVLQAVWILFWQKRAVGSVTIMTIRILIYQWLIMGRAIRAMWHYWKTITVLTCQYVVISCQVCCNDLLCLGILCLFSKRCIQPVQFGSILVT